MTGPAVHPARAWAFDDLVEALASRVDRGLVRVARTPEAPHLALYCYTQTAVHEGEWDDVVILARGLVLDHAARRVVATPFPKFFNLGERSAALPAESFEVYEKLDGSLAVVFHDGAGWRVATKGSLTSDQARWAQAWLDARDTSVLSPGHTYCAEIIYTANRIVVRYPFEGLVLLAAWTNEGAEYDWPTLSGVAVDLGARCVERHGFDSFDAMREAVAGFAADREGFVVRFAGGLRVKVKGAEYLRIHRLVSRVTPLAVWDVLANGGDLDVIRRDLPEEFWPDFDAIRRTLTTQADRIQAAVDAEVARAAEWSDKDLGLALPTFDESVRGLLFPARKAGAGWASTPKARAALWRPLRPTGNVLAGYVPSDQIVRAQEAES